MMPQHFLRTPEQQALAESSAARKHTTTSYSEAKSHELGVNVTRGDKIPDPPTHEWEPHRTEDASTCRRCGLTVDNTLRAAGWDEELVKTPCTCTIACIPQGITDEQTCRLQLENEQDLTPLLHLPCRGSNRLSGGLHPDGASDE